MKYEEKIRNYVNDAKKSMLKKIDKAVKSREDYIKLEFGYFKEQNLADFAEYYQQLITSYRLRHQRHMESIKKEHNEKYVNLKTFLEKKHKKDFDLAKIKYEEKYLSKNLEVNSEPSSLSNDEKIQTNMESVEKQKAEYLEKLNQTNKQIEVYKSQIRTVINNYAKVVSLTGKFGSHDKNILDKKKMLHKYLSRPTADDFNQIIRDEELVIMEIK